MTAFSKRHRRALESGDLSVELDPRTRTRIWRLLNRHNEEFDTYEGDSFPTRTDYLAEVADRLLDLLGVHGLPGTAPTAPHNLQRCVEKGPGDHVLDVIELFRGWLSEGAVPHFSRELNELLTEQDSRWRLLDGEMVPLAGAFVHAQAVARAHELIARHGFEGPAREMQRAQHDIADGDGRGAVHNAGSSFESTAKAVLGVDYGAAKKLIEQLKGEGYFDGLPEELVDGFIENVLLALAWMRNKLGGHGQGPALVDVPEPYARLALNLAASLNQFLIDLKVAREGEPDHPQPSDVPAGVGDFAPVGAADDDIPF